MRRETIQRWAAASIPLLAMLLVFAFGVLFHGAITDGTPKLRELRSW
jgi:hypothetical protein